MSYAHTKRRKKIAELKRKFRNWHDELCEIGAAVRFRNQGKLLGRLSDFPPLSVNPKPQPNDQH